MKFVVGWLFACLGSLVPAAGVVRLYPLLNDPTTNPQQQRAWTKTPGHLASSVRFAAYRGALDAEDLDAYAATGLGDALWPQYTALHVLNDTIQDVLSRNLWLIDISNYLPGDTDSCDPAPPGVSVCEYHLHPQTAKLLAKLGEQFTGMDNGEQDGRWMSFASQQLHGRGGAVTARPNELRQGFLYFAHHFERMADDLGFRLMSLNSLWYPHYYARTGYYTLLGAETAQGLPNDQIFYAFLRGAAKQYGLRVWGDASVGNRWWGPEGPKDCSSCICSEKGTSLALLWALMYQQLLYNSAIFSFEAGWTCGPNNTRLSPIGIIQKAGKSFVDKLMATGGSIQAGIGSHITQFAILLDYYAGFQPPRHLYQGVAFRVWGNLPWEQAEFWTHGVLNVLYPGYETASYFHNESGFLTPTPFGDAADVLLSDAPLWLLQRYPVVVVGSALRSMRSEVAGKLEAYVASGGILVITIDSLRTLSWTSVVALGRSDCRRLAAGSSVTLQSISDPPAPTKQIKETVPLKVCPLQWGSGSKTRVIASVGSHTLAVAADIGVGRLLVLASSGVASTSQVALPLSSSISQAIDKQLPIPFPLAQHARSILQEIFTQQAVFQVEDLSSPGLSVVATRRGEGEYLVAVANTQLSQRPFEIKSGLGPVMSVDEVQLDDASVAKCSTPGYTPTHTPRGVDCGSDSSVAIAGLSQRIFSVKVKEKKESIMQPQAPPPLPSKRGLPLVGGGSLVEQVLLRPSFFQHWDTIVVDWRYVEIREEAALVEDAAWAIRQRLRVVVDFSSGANLYPDLRFCNNSAIQYEASIARVEAVMRKMASAVHGDAPNRPNGSFSSHAILAFHRTPENYYSSSQCLADFASVGARLAKAAATHQISLYLRVGLPGKPPADLSSAATLLNAMGSPDNMHLALQLASVSGGPVATSDAPFLPLVGAWMVAGRAPDAYNDGMVGTSAPLACLKSDESRWAGEWLAHRTPGSLLLHDASLPHELQDAQDAEFEEAVALEAVEKREVPPARPTCGNGENQDESNIMLRFV